jgi:hypothetical protein
MLKILILLADGKEKKGLAFCRERAIKRFRNKTRN